jgi:hypothetical protein
MTLTQSQAATRAKAKVGHSNQIGSCLAECINPAYNPPLPIHGPWRFGGNGKAWAYNYWLAAVEHGKVVKTSDPMKIPAGALLFHAPRKGATTNGGRAGHVAIGAGNGYEYSTDQPRDGRWGKVKISAVEQAWGKKLVGYIVVTGDGVRLMPDPAEPAKPSEPASKLVRHFGHRHLNTWGDDGAEGTRTFFKRVDEMAGDLLSGTKPDVITLNEVQDDDVASWRKRLAPAGFDVVLAEAGNLVAIPAGSEVRKAQTKYLPASIQGAGRREALGMVRAKINGHWEHILVSHLDYRDGAKYDALRVRQADWIADQAKRWADVFDLDDWRTHTSIGIDENSHTWVRDKAFVPAGFDVAGKSGIDAIYGNRRTLSSRTIRTAADHPIIDVVYAKTVSK